jgi:hypothetical protein
MDQKLIILYLRMKGMALALGAIHDDLARPFGKDAVAYSTVTVVWNPTGFHVLKAIPK